MQQLHSRSVIALSIAAALALPTTAMANNETVQSDDVSTMDTITVLGQAYRNTATKTALAPEETPQSITTIDNETLEIRGVSSVSEAMRYVSGVNTEVRGGGVKIYDTFNIRGFDVNQSYYDGLALQYLSGWNLQPQIDPIAIEQIEVFKGPTSVLYGAMPPGGMVNIIPKTPQKERNTDISVSTGTNNLKEASIDTTGQIADSNFAYRVIAKASDRDSQAQGVSESRYLIAPSLDWQVSEQTLVNFNLYYQRDPDAGINSAAPAVGSVYNSPSGNLPSDLFLGDQNWNKLDREVLLAGYKINHEFNSDWTLLHNVRYMDASLRQENIYNTGFEDGSSDMLMRNAYSTDEESQGFTMDNQLSGVIYTGDLEHNVLFGVDYQKLKGSALHTDFGAVSSVNIYNPNTNQIDPSSLQAQAEYNYDIDSEQIGLYFQDQVRVENLVLIAGGRFDQYKSKSDDVEQDHFSYRLGALYEFSNGLSPFFSYATSFEPIAGRDKDDNSFKPSEGKQWEAGVKYMSDDMSKTATVSAFHITKTNTLVPLDPSDIYGPQTQTGEVVSKGVEFESQVFLTENLDVAVNYTILDMEITEHNSEYKGKTPIWVPEQTGSVWANYNVFNGTLSGATFGAGVRYVGETQLDALNTDTVPSYTLVDLAVKYDLGELSRNMQGASATVSATNLFNTDYYTCYDTNNCWAGAEQTIEAKINFSF